MSDQAPNYYVPHSSPWPIVGSIALFVMCFGGGHFLHQATDKVAAVGSFGKPVFFVGVALVAFMMFGWFVSVIRESLRGMNSAQLDRSYRQSMAWFILSEVMFFAAFFGALFYARMISVPWLAGAGNNIETHVMLWPDFAETWPLFMTPGGGATEAMGAWGLPFINTVILVISSVTVTFSHWALKKNQRIQMGLWLAATVALGVTFLALQVVEYVHAYNDLGLNMQSGIYGSTFYLLTGFHGAHVTMGTIMLTVMLFRCFSGHFSSQNHFAFEATSWYWHFVDVVWLGLFTFVYWF